MTLEHAETFVKTVSANDVGTTGGHQGGILIPKEDSILAFFPSLDTDLVNPRKQVRFVDIETGSEWEFNYIYYNGKITGESTRNEYRLTGMTAYMRDHQVAVGDGIELSKNVAGKRYISHLPANADSSADEDMIVLSGTWKLRRARTL